MSIKSLFAILIMSITFVGVMIYYGSQNNPFKIKNSTALSNNNQWSYDPPMYLCRLLYVSMHGKGKSLQEAGITLNWMTVATKNGAPPPTDDNPNILAIDGMADSGNDLDPNITYFFDQCLGPYSDNLSLCNAVKAQNFQSYVANVRQNDCRISMKMK
jgi:hypothetical protein